MGGTVSTELMQLTGKVVVITGANAGLGLESAKALLKQGATVVLACRNMDKGRIALAEAESASGTSGKAVVMALDLSDLDSVASFAEELSAKHPKIDCLMNNAGVMKCPFSKTKQGFEMQMGTNHLGHFALTMRLLPLLKGAEAPRIVNVSSAAAWGGSIDFDDLFFERRKYNPQEAYNQSKLANLLFHYELKRRLEKAGAARILAVAAHPGVTRTELNRHASHTCLSKVMRVLGTDVENGALSQIVAAAGPNVKAGDYYGPRYWISGDPFLCGVPPKALNEEDARKFWEVSEELTKCSFPW